MSLDKGKSENVDDKELNMKVTRRTILHRAQVLALVAPQTVDAQAAQRWQTLTHSPHLKVRRSKVDKMLLASFKSKLPV